MTSKLRKIEHAEFSITVQHGRHKYLQTTDVKRKTASVERRTFLLAMICQMSTKRCERLNKTSYKVHRAKPTRSRYRSRTTRWVPRCVHKPIRCLVKTSTNRNGESQNGDKKRLYCARLASTYFVHWLWNHWRMPFWFVAVLTILHRFTMLTRIANPWWYDQWSIHCHAI